MYQALYRKWRPSTFDEVTGQQHITETLKSQIISGKLSHAYLFTGTRGTGKTTCAKILARAVNCESPVDGNPCNCCAACKGILDGTILDVVEMDAASNNGVDDVRDLREEAVFSPTSVAKRVYIIDEVHMMSKSAFNALLKIMEEPPEHLMFILATTELQKVPATILSRCQRFSFKRIIPEDIVARLQYVAYHEDIDLTEDGATMLARLADGGMRDALSLLDQCSISGGTVDRNCVLDTLGLAGNLKTAHIFNAIRKGNSGTAIKLFGELYAAGKDISSLLNELSTLSRDLLVLLTVPDSGTSLLNGGYDEETLKTLVKGITAERLISILRLLDQAMEDCKRSGSSRTIAEVCLIRMCDPSLDGSNTGLAARISKLETTVAKGFVLSANTTDVHADLLPSPSEQEEPYDIMDDVEEEASEGPLVEDETWIRLRQAIISNIPKTGIFGMIKSVLNNSELTSGILSGDTLTIFFQEEFAYMQINKPDILQAITDVVSAQIGRPGTVVLKNQPKAQNPAKSAGSIADLKQVMEKHKTQ